MLPVPFSLHRRAVVAVLVLGVLAAAPRAARGQACGDVNGDGVSVIDASNVLRAAVGLASSCAALPAACDADGNGQIDVLDAANVLRAAVGLPAALVCPGLDPGGLGPRRTMLQSLTAAVILPTYRALDGEAADLLAALQALHAAPGAATLDAAQEAWRAARRPWKRSEAFRLGPSEVQRTAARIDWSPADAELIEAEIAGNATLSAAHVETLGASRVGFHAIEHLLFDPQGGAAVLAALSGPGGQRRRDYLLALGENLRAEVAALRAAWEPAEGNFGADLVNSGLGDTFFPSLKKAVDELVNRMIFTAEIVEETRIGAPLGVKTGGQADAELLESARSVNSLGELADTVQGVANAYRGSEGAATPAGMTAVTRALSPVVDDEITTLLAEAAAAVAAIPPPIEDALFDDPASVQNAYEHVQACRRALTMDLASTLGVTLTFGGTDGD